MISIATSVLARIREIFPESADRWSNSLVISLTHAADCIVKESAESYWSETEITLVQDGLYYSLPEGCIWVGAVLFSEDGTTYNDGVLHPTSFAHLDELDPDWSARTGTEPTHFVPYSAPGIPDYSKILLWPAMSSVTSQTVKVRYMACLPEVNLSFTAATELPWAVDEIYVPLVVGMLAEDEGAVAAAMGKIPQMRARHQSKYADYYSSRDTGEHWIGA